MGQNGLRRARRNDIGRKVISNDPEILAAMSELRRAAHKTMQDSVATAIQKTEDKKLKAWVAVAVWEDDDGDVSQTVMGDDHSSYFEVKGYLHDAVWTAAHSGA